MQEKVFYTSHRGFMSVSATAAPREGSGAAAGCGPHLGRIGGFGDDFVSSHYVELKINFHLNTVDSI